MYHYSTQLFQEVNPIEQTNLSLLELCFSKNPIKYKEIMEKIQKEPPETLLAEYEICQNSESDWISQRIWKISDPCTNQDAFLITEFPISKLKEEERALQNVNNIKTDFLVRMSHGKFFLFFCFFFCSSFLLPSFLFFFSFFFQINNNFRNSNTFKWNYWNVTIFKINRSL